MRVLGVHVSVQSGDRQGENRDEKRDRQEKRKEKERREKRKRQDRWAKDVRGTMSEKVEVYEDSKRLGSDSSRFNTCIDGQLCGKRCI